MIQRGDTIIEVILAVTIFSLVAVGALTLMNSGTSMSQRSLETTLVRQQIDTQAELLRFVSRSSVGTTWDDVKAKAKTMPISILDSATCQSWAGVSDAFALAATTSSVSIIENTSISATPETFARVSSATPPQSQGISVQLVRVGELPSRLYDAYIQACWNGPGSSRPMTLGTIVRIYDTAN